MLEHRDQHFYLYKIDVHEKYYRLIGDKRMIHNISEYKQYIMELDKLSEKKYLSVQEQLRVKFLEGEIRDFEDSVAFGTFGEM